MVKKSFVHLNVNIETAVQTLVGAKLQAEDEEEGILVLDLWTGSPLFAGGYDCVLRHHFQLPSPLLLRVCQWSRPLTSSRSSCGSVCGGEYLSPSLQLVKISSLAGPLLDLIEARS